jgi:putative SOS response-associated peptidase YedK
MCGRAKLPEDVSEIKLDLKIDFDTIGDYRPRWNAAPTSQLPVVVASGGARMLTAMRWGLIPAWASDTKIGYSTFNARAEDIETRPAFRAAWRAGRRCLVIADGYYEWRAADKQPFAVALGNHGPMTFAGLWEVWRDPAIPDAKPLKSFAIITTQANDILKPLHDRMPALLTPQSWAAWLGESPANESDLKAMLRPYPDAAMTYWPVDRRVSNAKNEGPDLFAPLSTLPAGRGIFGEIPDRHSR